MTAHRCIFVFKCARKGLAAKAFAALPGKYLVKKMEQIMKSYGNEKNVILNIQL